MNILFIIRSTRTFHYHRSVIEALIKRGHTVRALFDYEWSKTKVGALDIVDDFKRLYPAFEYDWALQRRDWRSRILFPAREIRSYRRYLVVAGQSDYYRKRWLKYTPRWFRLCVKYIPGFTALVRGSMVQSLARWIERHTPAGTAIVAELRKGAFDCVIVSPANMRKSSCDLEYLKAARQLRVPTAVQVISWDNLTTKGVFHVIPDVLLVWNETQREEALRHHGITAKQVRLIGAAVFDGWFSDMKPSCSREDFCQRYGFDTKYPILMYLGSTKNIAEDESWLVEKIRKALDGASDERIRHTQILVRPHPANLRIYERIRMFGVQIVPKNVSLPNSKDSLQLFYDSAQYAVATIGINTSGMIDTILAGRPGFAYRTDRYAKTQSEAEHFNYLVKSKAIEIVDSDEDFLKAYAKLISGYDDRKTERRAFIETYIRPHGIRRSAGGAAADEIERLIKKCKSNT